MSDGKQIVLGIGEILWDMLPTGRVLGGAPCNFAFHAQSLGAEARIVSAVGDDKAGRELMEALNSTGLDTSCISVLTGYPTGSVDVTIHDNGFPEYIIHEHVAWDAIPLTNEMLELSARADAICFGSLAQRSPVSCGTIRKLIRSARSECLVVYDVNLRQNYFNRDVIHQSLEMCNILKLNDEELPIIVQALGLECKEHNTIPALIEAYNLKLLVMTRGRDGSELYTENSVSRESASNVDIVDTVGAGDAFTAAVVVGVLNGKAIDEINNSASQLSGMVCRMPGAIPVSHGS